jgi:hypothetical protein
VRIDRITIGRHARGAAALIATITGGGILVLALAGPPAHALHGNDAVLTASRARAVSKASSNQSTLPQCGATRDPFDPTDTSGPPVGC